MSNWYNISRERAARIRADVVREVKDEVRAELEPVIREQVTSEILDQARDEAKAELEQEAEQRAKAHQAAKQELVTARDLAREELAHEHRMGVPSSRLRRGFVEFVKETELDARAQAVVASGTAERARKRLRWSRRTLGVVPWLLFAAAVPLLYVVFLWAGILATPAFLATSVGLLMAFLTILVSNARRHIRLDDEADKLGKVASDYLIMAERAKSYRLVHAERLETKARLDQLTGELRDAKVRLDERFHPPVAELEEAKTSVRHRFEVEVVDLDEEFDERLAEAEAEAAESERAEARGV